MSETNANIFKAIDAQSSAGGHSVSTTKVPAPRRGCNTPTAASELIPARNVGHLTASCLARSLSGGSRSPGRPRWGARYNDVAGLIPISESILDHHIRKFKAGGTVVSEADEAECRAAKHILTLGPAAILGAHRIVQSIVDADTAPAKRESYRRLLTTALATDAETRQTQFDENPGLWLRVQPNVRSLILPNVLEH